MRERISAVGRTPSVGRLLRYWAKTQSQRANACDDRFVANSLRQLLASLEDERSSRRVGRDLEARGCAEMTRPLVSVCIPVLDGGKIVLRAVRSALEQGYQSVEVVVVDDASTDHTVELLRAHFGSGIIIVRNRVRSGQANTTNAAIAHSHGTLIKFLHHDDWLEPDCIATMVQPFLENRQVGIAFSRRRAELAEYSGSEPAKVKYVAELERRVADLNSGANPGFTDLHSGVNSGSKLFTQLLDDGFRHNWIGEPSNVMVRRSCIDVVGGFSIRTQHWTDFDLWVRLLAHYEAAFIDRELSTYRLSVDSLTARNIETGLHWLDRLWIIENLMGFPTLRERYPQLERVRAQERHMAWRTAVRGSLRLRTNSRPPRPWIEYMAYRVRNRLSRVPT